jgi:hypothetical protein
MSTEFDYLGDPTVSKLFDLLLQTSIDLHVTAHRLSVVELALIKNGIFAANTVETVELTADETATLDGAREARVARVLRIITENGPAEHPLRDQWEAQIKPQVRA